jgi:hypothetical protein
MIKICRRSEPTYAVGRRGDSAAASWVRFGCEKETRWFGRALRHEAEKRANVRTDAPGKEGDGEKTRHLGKATWYVRWPTS